MNSYSVKKSSYESVLQRRRLEDLEMNSSDEGFGRGTLLPKIREFFGDTAFNLSELSKRLMVPNSKISKTVSDLVTDGFLKKEDRGIYRLQERVSIPALFERELKTLPLSVDHKNKRIILDLSLFSDDEIRREAALNLPSLLEKIERHKFDEQDSDDLWNYAPEIEGLPVLDKTQTSLLMSCAVQLPCASIAATSAILSLPSPAVWRCIHCGMVQEVNTPLYLAGSVRLDPPLRCSGCSKKKPLFTLDLEASGGISYRNLVIEHGGEKYPAITSQDFDIQKTYVFSGVLRRRKIYRGREYEPFIEIQRGKEFIDLPYDSGRAEGYLLLHNLAAEIQRSSIFQMSDLMKKAALIGCVEQANILYHSDDPGTGKTDLQMFLSESLMGDCYVDSNNASAAGIIAGIGDKRMLTRGALLKSRYVASIDEIDKEVFKPHLDALLFVLHNKRAQLSKIVTCDLPVTCSIFSGVNNIGALPAPLVSRYDLKVSLKKTDIIASPIDRIKPEEIAELRNALLYLRFQKVSIPEDIQKELAGFLNGLHTQFSRQYDHVSVILRAVAKLNRHKEAEKQDLKEACGIFQESFLDSVTPGGYDELNRRERFPNMITERRKEKANEVGI
jgi:hypothetical protein